MILKKLELNNIRSYDSETIEFPTGTTLLSGGVGSGKTSILLAIEYALFGLQPGQRGAALLANSASSGSVKLDIQIGDNEITLERALKRTAKTVSQDSASITVNGERSESSVTEVKTKVLELLNYPIEFIKKTNLLYRFTVYTPQEEMKQIIQESSENRLNILRHIFAIDKYKKIRDNLGIVTSKLREKSRMLSVEIKDLETNVNELETNKSLVVHLTNQLKEKKETLDKKVEERVSKEKERDELREKIREKEKFEREVEKTTIMLNSKRMQLSRETENIDELNAIISSAKEKFNEDELNSVIASIGRKRNELEGLNKLLIDISGKKQSLEIKRQEDLAKKNRVFKIDMCPTCLQDVSETHKHNILNETESQLSKSDSEIKSLEVEIQRINSESDKVRKELDDCQDKKSHLEVVRHKAHKVDEAKDKINELEESTKALEKDKEFLKNHIDFLKHSVLQFSKFDNQFNIKKDELKVAFNLEKGVEIEIAQLTKELEMIQLRIQILRKIIEKTQKTKEKLHYILDLEAWLSNDFTHLIKYTERNILMTVRKEFSKLFNKWFAMLTTDSFQVHLDENFTPVISQGDFEIDYDYLSGGERTAVALAYRLALNQIIDSMLSNIKTRGLIILDEPTDGFSDVQLDKIRDIIQELNTSQLVIVSHEQKVESFVDNIIRLKKEDGSSKKD